MTSNEKPRSCREPAQPKQPISTKAKLLWVTALAVSAVGILSFAGSMLAIADSRDQARTIQPTSPKAARASEHDLPLGGENESPPNGRQAYLRLQETIEQKVRDAQVDSDEVLERRLAELLDQAREKGRVTAVELETGVRLIMTHSADIERQIKFEKDMQRLQEELAAASTQETPSEAPVEEPARLLEQLERSQGAARAKKVEDYLSAIALLPPEEQIEATLALNEVTGASAGPQDPAVLDSLYQGMENANDEDTRAAFTRDYLAAMNELSIEEQLERGQALNELAAVNRNDAP